MTIDEQNLKCPICERNRNFNWVAKEIEISNSESNPIFYRTLQCHHCNEIILYIFEGLTQESKDSVNECIISSAMIGSGRSKPISEKLIKLKDKKSELIFQYPYRKTVFRIDGIPAKVKESLVEAEKCFSVGAKNGCAICLRKCIYAICDDIEKDESLDYVGKIEKLFPVQNEFSELTKQLKWLGDKHAHNINEESYTYNHIKQALDIMPMVIREIYGNKEKIKKVRNVLNQGLQNTKSK